MFFFKQKTAYEMRISDWSSDVCSSDLTDHGGQRGAGLQPEQTDRGGDRQFEEVAGADQRRGAGDAMGDAALPVKQIGQSGIEIDLDQDRHRQQRDDQRMVDDLPALEGEQQDQRGQKGNQRDRRTDERSGGKEGVSTWRARG